MKSLLGKELPQYKPIDLTSVPTSLTEISKLPVADLRSLLRGLNISTIGTKDEMAQRLYFVRANRSQYIAKNEIDYLRKIIKASEQLVKEQKKMDLIGIIDRRQIRKYGSKYAKTKLILNNTDSPFNIMISYLDELSNARKNEIFKDAFHAPQKNEEEAKKDEYEQFFRVGTKVKIKMGQK